MISRELLSIIEELDVTRICIIKEDYLYYKITDLLNEELEDIATISINLYELAHKIKIWALDQDYIFKTFIDYCGTAFCYVSSATKENFRYSGNTEPEAIFLAGKWVLEQMKDER